MSKIVSDFIESGNCIFGYGYFEGDKNVARYAAKVSRSQKRKYKRYGIIPAAFFNYLKNIEAIKQEKFIPEKFRTIELLLDLLWSTPNRNQRKRSEGECLRVEILKEMMPWLKNKLGTAEHVWRKGELYSAKQDNDAPN